MCGCYKGITGNPILCDKCYEKVGKIMKPKTEWKEEIDEKLNEVSEIVSNVMKTLRKVQDDINGLKGDINEIQKDKN